MEKRWVYYIGFGFIVIALLLAGSVILTANLNKPSAPFSPEVTISVPSPPVLNMEKNGISISYDLETSSFKDEGLNLIRVEVVDRETGKTLHILDGESLMRSTRSGSGTLSSDQESQVTPENSPLPRISVVLISDPRAAPQILTHRLTFVSQERAALPFIIIGGETSVITGNVSPK